MKNTRKILAIIMVVAMCFSMFSHTAFANATTVADGTAGEGITWTLDSNGTLTISGTGAMVVDSYAPPWEEYNESIISVIVEEGITVIPNTTFSYAENLVTVSIPSSATQVGGLLFIGCNSLEEINVAEDNTVYKSVDGILFSEDGTTLLSYPMNKEGTEYTIPTTVTKIGDYAFIDNQALESVVIPDTVTTLGLDAFSGSLIKYVKIGNGVTEIPSGCFNYSDIKGLIIPDSVKTLGYAVFWSASYLETLIIGSGIETLGEDILRYCNNLSVVHYKGTQDDWDAIIIDEANDDLNNKELHFITGEIKEETPPTCVDGHTAGLYCETCEDYLTGEVIPADGEHDYDDGVVTPPACTENGYTTYTCTVCEDWYTDDYTDPLGHQIGDDGLCGECGAECTHIDEDVDEKCDDCDAILDYEEVDFEETNTVNIPEAYKAVIVKFTPTESGWYAVISDNGGNDDINDPYVSVFNADGKEIAYNDDYDTYNFYCEFEAETGETYYIALYNYYENVEYDYTIEKHIGIDHQPTSAEPYVTLTWDLEAEYQWFNLDDEIIAIDGETEATLKNPKIGSQYGCLVTYNGVEFYSDVLYYDYAITHQPTAEEPYVELNDDTDATYQWYSAKESIVELTDENAIAFPSEDEGPNYDAEKGWSGIYIGTAEAYNCYAYFIVPLQAGDTISIELSGGYYGRVELIDMMTGELNVGEVDDDGKCEITVEEDCEYMVATYRDIDGDEVFVKAYANGYEFTKIDGATDAEYVPTEDGLYACEVTFADDSTQYSDVFEKITVPVDEDDDNTGNNTGDNTGDNVGDNTGDNVGDNTGDNIGDNTGNNTGDNTGDNVGDNTGDNVGDNTGDNIGDNTGNNTGDNTGGNAGNENTKPAPNPDIPDTDVTENNAWFVIFLMSAMGIALIMTSNKKRVFSK